MRDSGHTRGVCDHTSWPTSRPCRFVPIKGTGLSQNFDIAARGLRARANPAGLARPRISPDFHPEQVCQDRGKYDCLQSPADQRIRTGGPDLTIQVADLSKFLAISCDTLPPSGWGPAQASRAAVEQPITVTCDCESPIMGKSCTFRQLYNLIPPFVCV